MANEGRKRKLSAILSADVKDYSRLMSQAVSNMANYAIQVANELKNKISVEVIDPRTIAPLDIDTILESVKKTVGQKKARKIGKRACGTAFWKKCRIIRIYGKY
jgi:hypothetical protein